MSEEISSKQNQEEIDHLVEVASIDHIYHQILITTSAYILFILLVLLSLWSKFPANELLTWTAAAILLHIYRYYLYFSYWRGGRARNPPVYWGRTFSRSVMFQGMIWGAAAILFFPHQSIALQVFIMSLVIAFSVAFLALTPYWKSTFYAYALPANGALAWRLYMEGGDYIINALGVLIFTALASAYAMRSGKTVRDAIRLRYENDILVQQLREEKEKAEEASRVKTQFLASASHDLRQPVHSLSLLTEALNSEVLTAHGSELVGKLSDVTESLAGLLSSLLDISRLDAGVVKPTLSTMPLDNLSTVVENEFQALARKEGLRLRIRGCRGVISTDPDLLLDILRNLLTNALRYTRFGGVLMAYRRRGNDLLLQVWDTGIGIAESDSEAVFQEFNQLNNPQRDRSKGLGLGLAICRRLSKLLGYQLTLRSQLGRGTVFELHMPNAFTKLGEWRKPKTESLGPDMGKTLSGRTVLVIDDERVVRESTAALLQSWGMRVLSADGIEQAEVQVASSNWPVDIILADFRLRDGLTGSVVINQLRQMIGADIPGVIITGDTAPERIREARESGCALLHKPIKPGQLRTVLGKYCA